MKLLPLQMATTQISHDNLSQMNTILELGWLEGDYQPPNLLLAYEPITKSWYFVIDDFGPIIDLADGNGGVYAIEKGRCSIKDGVYICSGVINIGDYPTTDREYFISESLVPLLDETFTVV